MDIDDLKQKWQALDAKVFRLEARLVLQSGPIRREPLGVVMRLLIDSAAVWMVGSFLGNHLRELRFLVPAALLLAAAVAELASTVYELTQLGRIDYGAPVLASQRALEVVRLVRLRRAKLVFLFAPLAWPPLFIVALKALFDVDAYAVFGVPYIMANVLFGLAAIPVLTWAARRFAAQVGQRPWLQRIVDDFVGRNVARALRDLEALREFEA